MSPSNREIQGRYAARCGDWPHQHVRCNTFIHDKIKSGIAPDIDPSPSHVSWFLFASLLHAFHLPRSPLLSFDCDHVDITKSLLSLTTSINSPYKLSPSRSLIFSSLHCNTKPAIASTTMAPQNDDYVFTRDLLDNSRFVALSVFF